MANSIINNNNSEPDTFPREITFKAVFRALSAPKNSFEQCLANCGIDYTISQKISSSSNFISFTVSAHFDNEELLNTVCDDISSITGFMMMV